MLVNFKRLSICSFICLGLSSFSSIASQCGVTNSTSFEFPSVAAETHAPELIKLELESWIKQSRAIHPRFDLVVDNDELYKVKNQILEEITKPMNQLEIFRLFSQINPIFADGHHGISLPGYENQINESVKLGDRLFPLPVHINKSFQLAIKSPSNGLKAGTVIQSINGINAVEIAKYLEQHIHGDSVEFRRNMVSRRFQELLWQHYGSATNFVLGIQQNNDCELVTINGSSELTPHRRSKQKFEDQYSFELLASNQVGYLKADTFYLPYGYDEFYAFTQSAFAKLNKSGSKHLIIDIRKNGGGDDTMWIEGILPYIAKKPWQRMLHFLGRVRETDGAFPGRVGEVAIFDFEGEYEVSEQPKFDGQVYVITGGLSYSSAIMFSTIIRDNQLGKIVGKRTPARSCQTGMAVDHEMKTSGLVAYTPQHWYQRNSQESCMKGTEADIELADNPFDDREIVNTLVNMIIAK